MWVMKRERNYYVYILTNPTYTVLYAGVTNDLERRVWQHRTQAGGRFTKRYSVSRLVGDVMAALEREKAIKLLSRAQKNALVESLNPSWVDLLETQTPPLPRILPG